MTGFSSAFIYAEWYGLEFVRGDFQAVADLFYSPGGGIGRRVRFRGVCWQQHGGSSPPPGTEEKPKYIVIYCDSIPTDPYHYSD